MENNSFFDAPKKGWIVLLYVKRVHLNKLLPDSQSREKISLEARLAESLQEVPCIDLDSADSTDFESNESIEE